MLAEVPDPIALTQQRSRLPVGLLALLAASVFAGITTELLPVGLLPSIATALGVSEARVGVLVSVYAVVVAVGSVPLTALMMRWPRRYVLSTLLGAYAVSNIVVATTSDYGVALAARVLAGVAHAGLFSVVFSIAVSAVRPDQAGRAMAYVSVGNALAFSVGVPLTTALGTALGWRSAFVLCGVMLAALAVSAAVVLPPDPAPSTTAPPSVRTVLRRPALVIVALSIVLLMLGHYTPYTYITPLLLRAGVASGAVSLVLFGYGVAGVVGLLVAGWLVDRRLRPTLLAAAAVTALSLVALASVGSVTWAAVVAVVVWGVAFGTFPTLLQTLALRAVPDTPDVAPSVVNSTWNVGIAGGGLVGARELVSAQSVMLAVTGAILVAVASVLLVVEGKVAARRG